MNHSTYKSTDIEAYLAAANERKIVPVMFADLSWFSALAEGMDQQTERDLITDCFVRLVSLLERLGGVVDKFVGAQVLALHGPPCAHENDPERACRVSIEMMAAFGAFNTEGDLELGTRIGINNGLVISGEIGTGEHLKNSMMGDIVNNTELCCFPSIRLGAFFGADRGTYIGNNVRRLHIFVDARYLF